MYWQHDAGMPSSAASTIYHAETPRRVTSYVPQQYGQHVSVTIVWYISYHIISCTKHLAPTGTTQQKVVLTQLAHAASAGKAKHHAIVVV